MKYLIYILLFILIIPIAFSIECDETQVESQGECINLTSSEQLQGSLSFKLVFIGLIASIILAYTTKNLSVSVIALILWGIFFGIGRGIGTEFLSKLFNNVAIIFGLTNPFNFIMISLLLITLIILNCNEKLIKRRVVLV
tara:strand:+ start:32 stop:451 length:420 start_codon:yes stop_codon:yes gene_type:complete